MKKIFTLLVLMCSLGVMAQEYTPLVREGVKWNCLLCGYSLYSEEDNFEHKYHIEFKNEIFSDETTIFVKSVDQTYSMSEINVPAGVKSIRINTSSLPNGLYVLALVVNGQIVDNLKFDK